MGLIEFQSLQFKVFDTVSMRIMQISFTNIMPPATLKTIWYLWNVVKALRPKIKMYTDFLSVVVDFYLKSLTLKLK